MRQSRLVFRQWMNSMNLTDITGIRNHLREKFRSLEH
ncbi:Phosphate transport system permease PstA [Aeromonas salmonicida]|nr:Phosphate transport system permease PstA [Aeromonas salmonicida]